MLPPSMHMFRTKTSRYSHQNLGAFVSALLCQKHLFEYLFRSVPPFFFFGASEIRFFSSKNSNFSTCPVPLGLTIQYYKDSYFFM